MGTNYYIKGYPEDSEFDDRNSIRWHIGKRSAAGLFCFDCGISLGIGGNRHVHNCARTLPQYLQNLHKDMIEQGKEQYDRCPMCGKEYVKEDFGASTAGIELGFNQNQTEKRTGVRSASSFTFAMGLYALMGRLDEEGFFGDDKCIVDEYGREFSIAEFMDILNAIPRSLWFTESLGMVFS